MKTTVKFKSQNNQQLSGVLHTPDIIEIQAYALFAHCFTCTKDIKAATNIANTLANQGIATLRFDFAGLGASEGNFADTSFSTNIQDLISATEFLDLHYYALKNILNY